MNTIDFKLELIFCIIAFISFSKLSCLADEWAIVNNLYAFVELIFVKISTFLISRGWINI